MMGDIREKEGQTFPPFSFVVERGKIKEFVQAIGDPNPVYIDRDYAANEGYGDVIASPTFAAAIDLWGGSDFEEFCRVFGLNPVMVLNYEQEYEYFTVINPGDIITAQRKVVRAQRREGKAGGMNILTLQTTYVNQRGEHVMNSRNVIIERF